MSETRAGTYVCEACHEVCGFVEDWTEEQRVAEFIDNFGYPPSKSDIATVCDDCYRKLGLR